MVTAARKLGISACQLESALSQALQKSRSGLGFRAGARSFASARQTGKFSDWSSCDPLQVQLPIGGGVSIWQLTGRRDIATQADYMPGNPPPGGMPPPGK
uniref:hypothetical protein n=1 Tax=Limnobacter olei TaxID=3031298 RepID=UPI0023B02C61